MSGAANSLAWMVLTRTPGLSVELIESALARLGEPSALVGSPAHALASAKLPASALSYLARHRAVADHEQRWLEDPQNNVVAFNDPRFPPLLRTVRDCPLALYVRGDVRALSDPQVAIVGTRNPTAGGRDNALEFARYLGVRGLTITSGLAEGIDTAAHRGALAAEAPTVAVLGTGIDRIYPRANAGLMEQIVRQGAVVSEFPLQTPARAANFPQRNRIISGLSLGIVVVEAAQRSGSLITARLAGEQGREVFALPGSIHNPMSRGCHQLIRQGAKLTENGDDILSELNLSPFLHAQNSQENPPSGGGETREVMDKDREILLDALGFEPVTLDELVVRSRFSPDAVTSMLLILELEGHVQSAPGGRYSRTARRLST